MSHLDKYAVGLGHRQRPDWSGPRVGAERLSLGLYWTEPEGAFLETGGEDVSLRVAAREAVVLAEKVEEVRHRYLDDALRDEDVNVRRRHGLPDRPEAV